MKCGFYEREITPPIGDDIPGYNGFRFNTTIHDRLFVKAAAINTGEKIEDTVILIEMDLINVPPTLYDKALKKIEDLIKADMDKISEGMPVYKQILRTYVTDEPMIKTTTNKVKRFEEIKKLQK